MAEIVACRLAEHPDRTGVATPVASFDVWSPLPSLLDVCLRTIPGLSRSMAERMTQKMTQCGGPAVLDAPVPGVM